MDWTGADERGTASYTSYSRDHELRVEGKPTLLATSDLKVRTDVSRYRAEELFVAPSPRPRCCGSCAPRPSTTSSS
ncbi:hypothetical protein [Georgenia sp. SUBG003]|uniref:hypothetical protein n=1 Tax=Georgenia sp. SUBG003 TaxID=1497974 RepID=UPI003AB1B707